MNSTMLKIFFFIALGSELASLALSAVALLAKVPPLVPGIAVMFAMDSLPFAGLYFAKSKAANRWIPLALLPPVIYLAVGDVGMVAKAFGGGH